MLGWGVDHDEETGVGGAVAQADDQLVARCVDDVVCAEGLDAGPQFTLHVVDELGVVGGHEGVFAKGDIGGDLGQFGQGLDEEAVVDVVYLCVGGLHGSPPFASLIRW